MILDRNDLKMLRWPIAIAVLLTLAGIACVVAAERFLDAAQAKRKTVQTQLSSARERIARSSEEEKEIRANLVQYDRMVQAGIVGPRDRLDLVDKIAGIKAERRLYEIKYNIGAQRTLDYPGITPSGVLDFVNSPMQIDMLLLHEEDLLNFLADIRGTGLMYVVVRNCSLQRSGGSPPTGGPVSPTLRAACSLDLINLVEAKQG